LHRTGRLLSIVQGGYFPPDYPATFIGIRTWITVANLSRLPGGRRATDVERLLSVLAAAEGLGLVSQGEVGNFSKFTAEE